MACAEDAGDREHVDVTLSQTDGVPGIEGRDRYADYGEDLIREMGESQTVIRPGIANDPLLSQAKKDTHAILQLGAKLNVPLVRDGRLAAILAVHHAVAHDFTPEAVALAQEVAERT